MSSCLMFSKFEVRGWAWLCAISVLGCAACATPPPPPPVQVPSPPLPPPMAVLELPREAAPAKPILEPSDNAARHVLAYHDRVRQMSAAELPQELNRLNAAPGGPATILETALALGQTRNNGDLAKGLSLLESLLRIQSPELQPWHPIARLLATRFAEQRRLEEQIERLNLQLRDNQRESSRKLEQINEKLEALKAIERSLTVRSNAAPVSSTK